MKKNLYALFLSVCIFAAGHLSAQNLISSTLKGERTQSQLASMFGNPLIAYGVKYYYVNYTSPDAQGNLDTLSGLLVVPSDVSKTYPRLVYQHGTSNCKTCVPSRYGSAGGSEGELGLLFAGMGYISLLPDYVGMGDGRGFHPYVHAATEASAAADMLRASLQWIDQNAYHANNQIFVTGYSQGGHASMALHRLIEQELGGEMTVTAAAHLSGPYSIGGVMRDLILSPAIYFLPAYIPNTAMGYQAAYGNLYNDLTDLFKPQYASHMQQYYDGAITLTDLNTRLLAALFADVGSSVPRRMLQDSVLANVEANPQHPINVALRDNDVYQWAPVSPTRIFYCMADEQVPFRNSIVARDTMLALGGNIAAADVNSSANHGGCVNPALTQTLLFFAGFQQITVDNRELSDLSQVLVAPNPAQDEFEITGLPGEVAVRLIDFSGNTIFMQKEIESSSVKINIRHLPNGIYLLHLSDKNGRSGVKKIVVSR